MYPDIQFSTPHSMNVILPNAGKFSTGLKQNRMISDPHTNLLYVSAFDLAIRQAPQLFFECLMVNIRLFV